MQEMLGKNIPEDQEEARSKGVGIATANTPTITELCAAYLKGWKRRYEIEGDIAEGTYVRKRDQIIRYLEPYYGSLAANELTQDYVDAYPAWRETRRLDLMKQSRKKVNKKRVQYKKFNHETGEYDIHYKLVPYRVWDQRKPTKRSLRHDTEILIEIYNYCIFTKVIPTDCWAPIQLGRKIDIRRGYFHETDNPDDEANDFARVQRALIENRDRDRLANGEKRRSHHIFGAEQLYYWANLVAYTGLRTNEMIDLQHKHIEIDSDGDLLIRVVPERGTRGLKQRRRLVVADREALIYWKEFMVWRRKNFVTMGFFPKPSSDEYLWLDRHGEREGKQIQHRFKKLLMNIGITEDIEGNRLTSYSLRHTYCVRKLKQGVSIYGIARNMGTSVDRIEKSYGLIINATAMKKVNKEVLGR